MKKITGLAAGLMLAAGVLAGCAGGGSGGASGDGDRITVYSPETPEFTKELATKYMDLNGGNVDVQYAGTNVLVNQMLAEKDNPKADVWYGGGGILPFEAAVDRGILASYIPEAAEDWEEVEDGIKMKHGDGKYVGVEVFVLGFSYNTELVTEEEAPKTWDDLLDPKWAGKIQFPNPAASGTATLMVMDQLMQRGEEEGWAYFEKLVAQANSMPDSGSAPTKGVSMGEAHIGIGFDFMAYEQKAAGESVDFILPDKTPVLVNPASLIEGGPNPEGGKAFIDYLLGEEAQQIMADSYHIPINPNVESKSDLSLDQVKANAVDLDIDWVNENYDRVRNEWKDRFQ